MKMYHIYWWNQKWIHNVIFVHSQTYSFALHSIRQFHKTPSAPVVYRTITQTYIFIQYCILSDCFFPLLLYSVPLKHLIVSFKYIIISEDNWGFTESCETGLKDEDGAVRMRMWRCEDLRTREKSRSLWRGFELH